MSFGAINQEQQKREMKVLKTRMLHERLSDDINERKVSNRKTWKENWFLFKSESGKLKNDILEI